MIKSSFLGRLGSDAKVKESKNGKSYLQMDVATDVRVKGETKAMWIRVISSEAKHMGKLLQYLMKGKLVDISGTQIEPDAWIGKDEKAHAQVVVIANSIEFPRIGNKKDNAGETPEEKVVDQKEVQNIPDTTKENVPFPPQAPEENEDLPF